MLKKLYKKDGKIIIENDNFIPKLSFYYFVLSYLNNMDDLNKVKKIYYNKKGFTYLHS